MESAVSATLVFLAASASASLPTAPVTDQLLVRKSKDLLDAPLLVENNLASTRSPGEQLETLKEQGRMHKKKSKRLFVAMLVGLKVLAAGIILPSVVAIALYSSWKGITISLMALLLAGIVGLKNLFGSSHQVEKQHVILTKSPSVHEHWWRKDDDVWEKEQSPYRGYH